MPQAGTQLGQQLSFKSALKDDVLGEARTITCKEHQALNGPGSTTALPTCHMKGKLNSFLFKPCMFGSLWLKDHFNSNTAFKGSQCLCDKFQLPQQRAGSDPPSSQISCHFPTLWLNQLPEVLVFSGYFHTVGTSSCLANYTSSRSCFKWHNLDFHHMLSEHPCIFLSLHLYPLLLTNPLHSCLISTSPWQCGHHRDRLMIFSFSALFPVPKECLAHSRYSKFFLLNFIEWTCKIADQGLQFRLVARKVSKRWTCPDGYQTATLAS